MAGSRPPVKAASAKTAPKLKPRGAPDTMPRSAAGRRRYVARVRVKVRAGSVEICREGCGSGHGRGNTPGEAHESALKEAETDAMKRALTTFGNPFGLALYDKEQREVRGKPRKQRQANGLILSWIVLSAEGEIVSVHEDPTDYCKAMRQVLEASPTPECLTALWNRNSVTIEMLRANLPDLRTEPGEHYADVLLRLYRSQLKERRGAGCREGIPSWQINPAWRNCSAT